MLRLISILVLFLLSAAAWAGSIGLDFGVGNDYVGDGWTIGYDSREPVVYQNRMEYAEVAGVVPQANWTAAPVSNLPIALVDEFGQSTGAFATFPSSSTQKLFGSALDSLGDLRMMFGYFCTTESFTIAVEGLPAEYVESGYEVIVYYTTSETVDQPVMKLTLGAQTLFTRATSRFDGTYVQGQTNFFEPMEPMDEPLDLGAPISYGSVGAPSLHPSDAERIPAGNYARFEPTYEGSFVLTASTISHSANVSGLQIVQVPEPGSAILSGLALSALGFRRRR